jgi:4,5:9,10-diseco-3-hydroxy-5,9,17-trioxoandrosta-1(10),2-diene-4-oate hydrolase
MTALLDFDATSHTVAGSLPAPLHYHEAGDGPALIMLHGSGPGVSGWSNFKGNLPVFARSFRTLLLDMPGFGRSPLWQLDRRYPEVAADAVVQFMDALGIESAHLLGNSMGGAVAMHTALTHPERVDRMVLMGPPGVNVLGTAVSEGGRRLNEFLAAPSRERMVAWIDTMVAKKSLIDDALIDERMETALRPGVTETARQIFANIADPQFNSAPPLWTLTNRIPQPTLITWGRDDRMIPLDNGLLPFRRMPNAELHVFSRCGHWAQVERKEDFERVALEFLSRP